MVMNWLHRGTVVDGNTLRPPKNLRLVCSGLSTPPKSFSIYRVYSPAAESLRNFFKQPDRQLVTSLEPKPGKKNSFEAAREWMLPAPYGMHFATQFVFTADGPGVQSPRVRSHRLGTFHFGAGGGGSVKAPTPAAVPIGVEGSGRFSARFLASVDPLLTVQALTGDDLLRTVFENEAFDDSPMIPVEGGGGSYVTELWSEVKRRYSSLYRLPVGWAFEVSPETFTADEGSDTEVVLNVVAPTPGVGLVALLAVNQDAPEQAVISDIIQVSANARGFIFASPATNFPHGDLAAAAATA